MKSRSHPNRLQPHNYVTSLFCNYDGGGGGGGGTILGTVPKIEMKGFYVHVVTTVSV